MFVNVTNHPSAQWSAQQRDAGLAYGEICDIPFPHVAPDATAQEVEQIAQKLAEEILQKKPNAVLCQGEFTLCFTLVRQLQKSKLPVLAACTERVVSQSVVEGQTVKTSVFQFVQFRAYSPLA